jgi:hypothetical protein
MSSLSEKAHNVLETCDMALGWKGRDLPALDVNTVNAAIEILKEAKSKVSNDKVLNSMVLNTPAQTWTGVRSAMRAVIDALPTDSSVHGPPSHN